MTDVASLGGWKRRSVEVSMLECDGAKNFNANSPVRYVPTSYVVSFALHAAVFGAAVAAQYFLGVKFLPLVGVRVSEATENAAAAEPFGSPDAAVVVTLDLPLAMTSPAANSSPDAGPSPIEPPSAEEPLPTEPEVAEISATEELEPVSLEALSEVRQDDQRFVSAAAPAQDRAIEAVEAPSSLAAEMSGERPSETAHSERPTDSGPATDGPGEAVAASPSRRRATASADMRVASVDAPPARLRFVGRRCRYPEIAIRSGWQGEVVLSIRLDDAGKVVSVEIHKSSGIEVFDAEAIATARTWRAVSDFDNGRLWATHVLKPVIFVFPEQ